MRDLSRLQELAEVLKLVPADRFDLQGYLKSSNLTPAPFSQFELLFANLPLVTSTLGWAVMYQPFAEQGLTVIPNAGVYNAIGVRYQTEECSYTHDEAVQKFFGLTQTEVDWIFYAMFYSPRDRYSPSVVIARIENFVRNDGMDKEDLAKYNSFYQKMLKDIVF